MTWPIDDLIMTGFDQGTDFPESSGGRTQLLAAVNKLKAIIAQLDVADGVCGLNAQTKVDLARILRSAANGIAELDAQARLPLSALILNVANGLLASNASNRCALANSSLVLLSTPELITSTPTDQVWTTVNNATLNTANALYALVRAVCFVDANNNATTDPQSIFRLRTTGQSEPIPFNIPAYAYYNKVAASNPNYAAYCKDAGLALVPLNANHDFDFYWDRDFNTANYSHTGLLFLVGYIK